MNEELCMLAQVVFTRSGAFEHRSMNSCTYGHVPFSALIKIMVHLQTISYHMSTHCMLSMYRAKTFYQIGHLTKILYHVSSPFSKGGEQLLL